MAVDGANWPETSGLVSPLSSLVGTRTRNALQQIKRVLTNKYLPFNDLLDSFKSLRPVYKVMITVPHLKTGNTVVPYRYILADTSRPYVNFLAKGDSPIVGMWVDQSDLIEPDKVILLMQNPMSHEGGTFESDVVNFPQFGVRNWLDIWMGYAPLTPGRSLMNLGQIADQIDLASLRIPGLEKVAFTLPDPFFFGSETHLFSGPIVSIKRQVTSAGDRLQMVGFSPIIILRQLRAKKFEIESGINISNAIINTATSIATFPPRNEMSGFVRDDELFHFGRFTWNMFGSYSDFLRAETMRVFPTVIDRARFRPTKYPLSNPQKDQDLIIEKMDEFELRTKIEPSKKTTLYNILFRRLTDPTLTGLYGLYAFIRPLPAESNKIMWAFRDGEGHPGVYVRYGFKFEIDGILHQIEEERNYGPEMRQEIILGRTAREFEGGIEYGTVFNTKQFMAKTGEEEGELKDLICPTGQTFLRNITAIGGGYVKHKDFWEALLDDISVYGECFNPVFTWIWGEGDQAVDLVDDEVANSVAQIMRESYFAGMGGSVFAVGNPSFKPGRVLDIRDERNSLGKDLKQRVERQVKARASKMGLTFRQSPASPPALRLKGVDKKFYIWKTRHYLGVKSGYITKLYFIEERNRAWQQYTENIDSIIRAALGQAKQLMGVI